MAAVRFSPLKTKGRMTKIAYKHEQQHLKIKIKLKCDRYKSNQSELYIWAEDKDESNKSITKLSIAQTS